MKLINMRLENFRCFNDLEVTFDPKLTVFVGVNGAGKTAVLDAVAVFLKQIQLWVKNTYRTDIKVSDICFGRVSINFDYVISFQNKKYNFSLKYNKNNFNNSV